MKKYVLMIDSGSDVPQSIADRRGFEIVRMHTMMGNKTYDDGKFPVEDLFKHFEITGVLPKTSASTPDDFGRAIKAIRKREPDSHIVYLAYSAATTSTFQSACIAAEGVPDITLIDTQFCSAGQAAVIYHIADLIESNPDITPEEIEAAVAAFRKKLHMIFVPGDLQYLKAGGRLTNSSYVGARLLNLHPQIETIDGVLVCTRKLRGNLHRVYIRLLKEYLSAHALSKEWFYLIESYGLDPAVRQEAEQIVREAGLRHYEWITTGGVVSVHCGPGSFGFVCIDA